MGTAGVMDMFTSSCEDISGWTNLRADAMSMKKTSSGHCWPHPVHGGRREWSSATDRFEENLGSDLEHFVPRIWLQMPKDPEARKMIMKGITSIWTSGTQLSFLSHSLFSLTEPGMCPHQGPVCSPTAAVSSSFSPFWLLGSGVSGGSPSGPCWPYRCGAGPDWPVDEKPGPFKSAYLVPQEVHG